VISHAKEFHLIHFLAGLFIRCIDKLLFGIVFILLIMINLLDIFVYLLNQQLINNLYSSSRRLSFLWGGQYHLEAWDNLVWKEVVFMPAFSIIYFI